MIKDFRRKIEFGDVLLAFYLVAFVRQYLWPVHNEIVAWSLTVIVTVLLSILFLYLKDDAVEIPARFWIVVGVPLLVVFVMRFAFPDTSYDVLNYRLVSAERGLRGWPFIAGDFFPPFYPLNPAPDMLLGISRHVLGYRLGTVFNFLAMLWAGAAVYKIVQLYIANRWLSSVAVLLVLWTEHGLFVINNYLVDLLAVPLLLEAVYIALRAGRGAGEGRRLVRLALLLGLAAGLKPLNLAYAIPVVLVYLYMLLSQRTPLGQMRLPIYGPLASIAFLFPLAPYSLYIYAETGNPVFPLFNSIFRSPYWPAVNLYDGRWGAHTVGETLLWPLRIGFDATRTGELAVNSGRITLVVVASLIALTLVWSDRSLRTLSFATLLAALLWSATLTGYARYAIFVELLGGTVLVCAISRQWSSEGRTSFRKLVAKSVAVLLMLAFGIQLTRAANYIRQYEWSGRQTLFRNPSAYWDEMRLVFNDYQMTNYLRDADRGRFEAPAAWIEIGPLSSAFYALLTPNKPILCAYIPDYFFAPEGRERFARALAPVASMNFGALCHENDLPSCMRFANERGLDVVETSPMAMPVYSRQTRIRMYLMTLKLSQNAR